MVVTRSTSVKRNTTISQPTRGTPIARAGDGTTPTSQMLGGGLETSSSARLPRPPTTTDVDASNQIPLGDPHVELEDPNKVNPQVKQFSQSVANLQ
uniref:Uncharacterized protein n=1 Tax=Cannabis sativa TaxID=3483 RepID=A0A803NKT3_CANSA